MRIKKVLFFCKGDSRKASTWSNVPYLFCKTLEEKGIDVVRINTSFSIIESIWNKTIYLISKKIFKGNEYSAMRTFWMNYLISKKIKNAVLHNSDADLCIFIGFSYYNQFNSIPSLLFGDWTFEILIKDRLKRSPFFFEKWVINRENNAIKNANIVISLFPQCAKQIEYYVSNSKVFWGERNVINTLYNNNIDTNKIIKGKNDSHKILFVGRKQYIKGAELLVNTYIELLNIYPLLELHIIGLNKTDFKYSRIPKGVHFYGFLRKENAIECNLYYQLLLTSKVFVNPSPSWGGYSSTIEAMYYYTPIIISPYDDFVEEFGENIDFGLYNNNFTHECLKNNLLNIMQSSKDKYYSMCLSAHDKVKNYTWNSYTSWLIKICEESLIKKE